MIFSGTQNNSPRTIEWSALGWAYLFFLYFSGVHHFLLQIVGATTFVGARQAVIASTLWLIPLLAYPKHARPISAVIGVILWAFSLVSLGYFCIYRQEFSQSVIFIIFESNVTEASEYFAQYFVWWMIPALIAYSVVAYWLWHRIRPLHMPRIAAWGVMALVLVTLFVYPNWGQFRSFRFSAASALEKIEKRMESAVPWQIILGYSQYRRQLAEMQMLLEQNNRIPPLNNLRDAHAGKPATLVLILGESTSVVHMGLYGYSRPTTPRLEAKRNELSIFKHVYASRPYTIEALQQVLTFADQEHPDLYLTQPSLMNMMKQAGYKTYWITNHQTLTKRNTMLTNFSQQVDEQVYLNNTRIQNSREFDDDVFESFKRVLNDSAERKLIIVHLLGTHMKYEYRYPSEYDVFKDRKGLPDWVTEAQVPVINNYDNAVLFNDYVVSSLIDFFSASKTNGFLVYFSDHGEDVFDSPGHEVLGRNEMKPTLPMYSVPFFIWSSESWSATHPRKLEDVLDRTYGLEHFIHTWADLSGLTFDGFDSTKSILSKNFKERKVLVGDPVIPKSLIDLRTMIPSKK